MSSRADRKRQAREAREQAEREATASGAQRRRTAYLAGGIALVALVVVVALVLVSQSGSDDGSGSDPNAAFAGIEQENLTLGDPQAPVTVVEYADLQCPFCGDFAVDDLPGIVDDYVEPGEVKLELQLLGFLGADSETGRQVAAGAAQQNLLWEFSESVYAEQGTEGSGYMDEEFLRERAEAVEGLDAEQALAAIDSPEAERLGAEADSSAGEAGVNSTPTFLVRLTEGGGEPQLVSADGLRDAIDQALAEAGG